MGEDPKEHRGQEDGSTEIDAEDPGGSSEQKNEQYSFITLIVDDNPSVSESYKNLFEMYTSSEGEVIVVDTPEEAMELLEEARLTSQHRKELLIREKRTLVHIVMADKEFANSEKLSGVDVLAAAKKIQPFPPYTVSFTDEEDDEAFQENSDSFLSKSDVDPAIAVRRVFKQAWGHFGHISNLIELDTEAEPDTESEESIKDDSSELIQAKSRGTKPMYFPKKKDAIIRSTSNLKRVDGGKWVLANMIAPTEVLDRLYADIKQHRERFYEVIKNSTVGELTSPEDIRAESADGLTPYPPNGHNALAHQIQQRDNLAIKLGGDIREAAKRIYDQFDFDHYWFKDAFGDHDRNVIEDQLKHVAHEADVLIGKLKVLDVGTGGEARILKILIDIVDKLDPEKSEQFKRNVEGFDIVRSVVTKAKTASEEVGVPRKNVIKADFLDLPDRFQKENYHLITAMMHTPWHNITEENWTRFLKNMSDALTPGGRLLFDTVSIIEPHDVPDRENTFDDLYSFYTLLSRQYSDEMQPIMNELLGPYMDGKPVPLLRKLPRNFVKDQTAGVEGESFIREVPRPEFLTRICEDNDIPLKLIMTRGEVNQKADDRNLMSALGERWVKQNNLGEWLTFKVMDRIFRRRGENPSFEEVSEINREVMYQIACSYQNKYLSFRKKED